MSPNVSTSFKELLNGIQSLFSQQYADNSDFRSIKGNYKGAPRNPSKFPYTAIVPIQETHDGIYNGVIDTVRRVRIFAYTHHSKSRSAMRQSMGIIDNIKDKIFLPYEDHAYIKNKEGELTTFEFDFPNIQYSQQPYPWKNGFLQFSTLDIDFYSRERLVSNILNETPIETGQVNSKTITDAIYNTYKSYSMEFLSEVISFKDMSLTPQTNFPVLFLSLEDANYGRRFAGIDTVNLLFYINVLSRASKAPEALDQNIDIVEKAKEVLFANCDFGGKAIDYNYQKIEYGQLMGPGGLLYGSSLQFFVQTYNHLIPTTN